MNKKELKHLIQLAYALYNEKLYFSRQMTNEFFQGLKDCFGETEASGFLNLVLETIKMHKWNALDFNKAVTETIVLKMHHSTIEISKGAFERMNHEECRKNISEKLGREITSCSFQPKSKANEECPEIQECYDNWLRVQGDEGHQQRLSGRF